MKLIGTAHWMYKAIKKYKNLRGVHDDGGFDLFTFSTLK